MYSVHYTMYSALPPLYLHSTAVVVIFDYIMLSCYRPGNAYMSSVHVPMPGNTLKAACLDVQIYNGRIYIVCEYTLCEYTLGEYTLGEYTLGE